MFSENKRWQKEPRRFTKILEFLPSYFGSDINIYEKHNKKFQNFNLDRKDQA